MAATATAPPVLEADGAVASLGGTRTPGTGVAHEGKAGKKAKVPLPGAKGEPSTAFYTRKKWRTALAQSELPLPGKELNALGALIVSTALLKNRTVVTLDLSHNTIGDEGAVHLAQMLRVNTSILHLNLSHNGITDVGGIALAGVFVPCATLDGQPGQWNRTLFSLNLLGNALGDDSLLALCTAAGCHRDLTLIDVRWNRIGPTGTKRLQHCLQRNPLCNILLAANDIGDEGAGYLCEALARHGGRAHRTLDLYRNDISRAGAGSIGRLLAGNSYIQDVNLHSNTLGAKGAQVLCQQLLSATHCIRTLNLAGNLLSDAGAVEVAAYLATDPPSLEKISLADNRIGDTGGVALAKALLSNTHLQHINLMDNDFGNATLTALVEPIRKAIALGSMDLRHSTVNADSSQRRALTLATNESQHVHVNLGAIDDNYGELVLHRLSEHMQMVLEREAQAVPAKRKTPSRSSSSKSGKK